MNRRGFLRAGLIGGASALLPGFSPRSSVQRVVSIIIDPADPVAAAEPARWALTSLERALTAGSLSVRRVDAAQRTDPTDVCVMASGPGAAVVDLLRRQGVALGDGPERFAIVRTRIAGRSVLLACATDPRGLTYALTELTDRLQAGGEPLAAFTQPAPLVERPTNQVRSVMRQFTSQPLDTAWFNDREMWPAYLDLVAGSRFNRLHLAFGLAYDFLQHVADSYFLFLYPFLVDVPGYAVRVTNLTDGERERNLAMLRFISEQAVARGLTFQLGVWMHGYQLADSPQARHIVEGLTPETHPTYCRDALTAVLRACPAISAVALRIHGESGVKEGSYDFWGTVFDGVARSGRRVEIDLHAKGIDQEMINRALATGLPVNVSPKYWAEHLGMPYHQAAIRELEMPVEGHTGRGLMALSEGARSFTRYGYADLLRDDRRYTVRHRVFYGTQRILQSADPLGVAAYSRMFQFCGSTGMDLMEPLTFRGRRGSGIPGTHRSGYLDDRLEPRWDWEKFSLWYRTWGRLTYNADAGAAAALRPLGPGAEGEAQASSLAAASRILPMVTTSHLPSAACDAYWPEVYWNQPIVAEPVPNPYGDTPAPKVFTTVSPLDPQLFSSIQEAAGELLSQEPSGKYTPLEVASWLEELADAAAKTLAPIEPGATPTLRRLVVDVTIQAGLGRFFAAKFRAGVLYSIHQKTRSHAALDAAVVCYRRARQAWADLSAAAGGVYADDLSIGDRLSEHGHWRDRLAAIDEDISRMAQRLAASAPAADDSPVRTAVAAAQARPARPSFPVTHASPAGFTPGTPLLVEMTIAGAPATTSARCLYRHVNQAERFQTAPMERQGDRFHTTVPGPYTGSPYSLQYYFTILDSRRGIMLHPGLGSDRMGLPYFVVHRTTG